YTLNLYKQASHLSEESNKARFIALQNQLNPHFLFNSLNTLVSEIEYNPKNAVAFTTHLSDVYRYILLVQDKTLVSLKDEMEFLESFLFLHQVRLGDCIHRDIIFNDELYERKLPPLTLQLLAENVVKHNSISMRSPMTISIRYNQETKVLEFSNRVNPRKGIPSSGRGLQNLNGRYQLIAQQEIEIREENGFFKVSIPLLYE
ncbi:MAG: sensor histidine kinase, partial [Bacteroidales bacterium]